MASSLPLRYQITQRAVARTSSGKWLWTALSLELSKIIGTRGFESLYLRSLLRARMQFPWLASQPQPDGDPLSALGISLELREPAEAHIANAALLNIFTDTLILLIGELITERILCAAWGEDLINDIGPEQQP